MNPWDRPGWVPPFVDLATLALHICAHENTIENWVRQGIFPAPRMQGGKRMWSWKEVEKHLAGGNAAEHAPVSLAERIKEGTRRAAAGGRQ